MSVITTNTSHRYPGRDQNEYNLPYVESQVSKNNIFFCTRKTLHKMICKPEDRVVTKDRDEFEL